MEHTTALFEVPELEKILAKKKKRYVGYEEGMALYRPHRRCGDGLLFIHAHGNAERACQYGCFFRRRVARSGFDRNSAGGGSAHPALL